MKESKYLSITGKVIVYSGVTFVDDGHLDVEVIDLLNPSANCDIYAVIQDNIVVAFGGKVSNEYLLCGGQIDLPVFGPLSKKCFKIGETAPFLELLQPRALGASVVLPNNTLLITGELHILLLRKVIV